VKEEKIDLTSKNALNSFLKNLLRTLSSLRSLKDSTSLREKIITNTKAKIIVNKCNKCNNII